MNSSTGLDQLLQSVTGLCTLILIICLGMPGIVHFSLLPQQYNESNDFSYALKLYNEGFYDIAAQQFSVFINRYPTSDRLPDARYYLATSLYQQKDFEDARIEYQSLAVGFPNHPRAPEAWYKVGECYQQMGKVEEAARSFETLKTLFANHALAPRALLNATQLYFKLNQINRAEKILKDFLDRYLESADYPRGRLLYGSLLIMKNELERASNEFRKVLKITKDKQLTAQAQLGLARVYRKLGLLNKAATTYEAVLQTGAGSRVAFGALKAYTGLLQETGDLQKALSLINGQLKYYSLRYQKNALELIAAQTEFLMRDYFSARKRLQKLLDSAANDTLQFKIKFYLAACYQLEQKVDQAITIYEELLTSNSKNEPQPEFTPVLLINLARLHLQKGNFTRTRRLLYRFQEDYPASPDGEILHRDFLKMVLKHGDFSTATKELQRFLQKYPESRFRDDVLFLVGKAFFQAKKYSESQNYFKQVVSDYYCSEKYDSSRAYLDYIQTNHIRQQELGVNELARLVGKILVDEDRTKLLFELGQIYLKVLKDYREAARIFEETVSITTDSTLAGEARYYLSESYLRLWQVKAFLEQESKTEAQKAVQALKEAMPYIHYVPHPDTLMFRFLTRAIPDTHPDPEKLLDFWRHFEISYPESELLPIAKLRMVQLNLQKGDTAIAQRRLNEIIQSGTTNQYGGLACWKLSRIYGEQGNRDLAINTLKDFLLKFGRHPLQARAYWELATYYEAMEEYLTAAKYLEKLYQSFNYTSLYNPALEKITNLYIKAGKYQQALSYISLHLPSPESREDPVLKFFKPSWRVELYFYAGKAHFQMKRFDRARKALLAYLNHTGNSPNRGEAQFLLGKMAQLENDPESALMHFSLVEKGNPYFSRAKEMAAGILFQQGNYVEARKKYEELLSLTSKPDQQIIYEAQSIRCLINQGNKKLYESRINQFKKTYRKHAQLKNYLASFEYELGKLAYRQKSFNIALKHFTRIQKKYKTTDYVDDASYYLGLCYTTLNREEKALKELNRFLQVYPSSSLKGNVLITLGSLHYRAERTELALDAFRKAVEAAADDQTRQVAMGNLIKIYQNLGLWDGALQIAREYIQQFPRAQDVMDKKILVGICLINLNRHSEAVEYLKGLKFEATSEQEPEIQFYIGEAYFNARQYENAISEFVKIPLLSRRTKLQWEASALYYSGQAYEKMGRIPDAIRMYQEIIDRPGILIELKREARKRIDQLQFKN